MPSTADSQLIQNLENQLGRLCSQLSDLEECRNDLTDDEYSSMKEETVDQIKEFTETLDRMSKSSDILTSSFSQMRKTIRQAIANSFNTIEMIKMFGEQNATEMEAVLLGLDQEYRLKKIPVEEYETKKSEILMKLKNQGHPLSKEDNNFLEKRNNSLFHQMEQLPDDDHE
ncbi:hypothetical protein HA402_000558 [Bradysia odoriphaga]|nr:hypothetical protein HA402_000558 [Bradysia odoriphaga]